MIKQKQQEGNALFLVFIAIALFAAVSYAVTQSSRGSGDIDREQLIITSGRILEHFNNVRSAVQRMMLFNGCQDNEIAFYDASGLNIGSHAYPTADIPSIRPECNVFDPLGGGLESMIVPEEVERLDDYMQPAYDFESLKDIFTRSFLAMRGYVRGIGRDYTSTTDFTASELALTFQMRSRDMCILLNKGLDVPNPGGDPPTGAISGNFMAGDCRHRESRVCSVSQSSYPITELDNLEAACFYNPNVTSWINSDRYTFYMVLAPG